MKQAMTSDTLNIVKKKMHAHFWANKVKTWMN